MSIWKNEKLFYAVVGGIVTVVAKKVLKAKKTRELAVKGLAEGMKITAEAKATFQDMKDEASDICNDAKAEAGLNK